MSPKDTFNACMLKCTAHPSRCVCVGGGGGRWSGEEGSLTPNNLTGNAALVLSKGTSNHTKTNNNKMHTRNEKAHTSTSFHKKMTLIVVASYSKNRVI